MSIAAPLLTVATHSVALPSRAGSAATAPARALPLQFEANQGQADPSARFLAPEPGGTLFLTEDELVFSLNGREAYDAASASTAGHAGQRPGPAALATPAVVRMRLAGGATSPSVEGTDPLPSVRNYMVGDRSHWHLGVPSFARVTYRNVYPGIDLVVHGETGAAEYDFVVAPGTSPHAVTLDFSGQRTVRLDGNGDLVLETAAGALTQHRPVLYQEVGGSRRPIPGGFHLLGAGRVGFNVGRYDGTRPLVIDPVIAYSTFVGGSGNAGGDDASHVTVDSSGNAYIVGPTQSTDFPATTLIGPRNVNNAYVLKLNPSGSAVVWATVFGGSNTQGDNAAGVALDPSGNVWVTGFTHSVDFPTTTNAFKPVRTCAQAPCRDTNAFVSEFNTTGTALLYSTYLGGHGGSVGSNTQTEAGRSIAIDSAGKAYVTGSTSSPDFPTTTGAFQSTYPSTCCNGVGYVAKFDSSQSGAPSLVYSTFVRGSIGSDLYSIAVDAAGDAVVGGGATAVVTDYPVTTGAYQNANRSTQTGGDNGVITKLNAAGSALLYSTYLGGSQFSSLDQIALGPNGRIYISGHTKANDFPTTAGGFSRTFHGGSVNGYMTDGFFSIIAPNGNGASDLMYSTYIGGHGDDDETAIAADASGNAYLLGITKSSDWPLQNPVQGVWEGQNVDFQYNADASVAEIHPAGGGASDLLFSTYLGGTGDEQAVSIALGAQGAVYVAGTARGGAMPAGALPVPFPTTRGALRETWNGGTSGGTGFVTKFDLSGTTALLAVAASNGGVWSKGDTGSYGPLGGVLSAAPAVVAVPVTGGLPAPLYIGTGSDHNLYVRSATQGWQALSSSPVSCLDSPGATVMTSAGISTLTVACQGSDHALWYAQGSVGPTSLPTVSGWQGLGGGLSAGPAVATVAGALTFMVLGSDGQAYSRTTSAGYAATGWRCIGHPALAAYRSMAAFACHGGDGALWYSVNGGSGWQPIQSAGGAILDGPGIAATPAEVVIAVEGTDHTVYHTTVSPGGGPAMPFVADGGVVQFGPGAATLTP